MKSDCIIPCNSHRKQPRHLTSAAMVREDWLSSGIPEALIESNKAIIITTPDLGYITATNSATNQTLAVVNGEAAR